MSGETQPAKVGPAPAEILATLSEFMPELKPFWARKLKEYAAELYTVSRHRQANDIRNDAMQRLSRLIANAALKAGYSPAEMLDAQDKIWQSPILQTGPHCHLLVEPDAFYTHLFSLMGLNAHRLRWHFWYGTSTVKFIESARKGPGWLRIGADTVNVFGLPRRRMDAFSVCGLCCDEFHFRLTGAGGAMPNSSDARELFRWLPRSGFPSAADAIKTANLGLWPKIAPDDVRLLQLDDFDVADLIADHLDDPTSWLASHLCAGAHVGNALLESVGLLDCGPWNGWIRTTTDLFWGLSSGRLVPLRLCDTVLVDGCRCKIEVPFEAKAVASALRQRTIVPGLLMTFLVLSILPGTRVLGGCRQAIYYPLMRHVVAMTLLRCGFRDLVEELAADRFPGCWGHRVLKPEAAYPLGEILSGDLPDRARMSGDQALEQACGDLASFTRDPLWAKLCSNLRTGVISSTSPEWQPCR